MCSAVPAEDWEDSRSCAEGEWIIFATLRATMSEWDFVNLATKQDGEDPIPTNMHSHLVGDAGWTESIACPHIAKTPALVRHRLEAQKTRGLHG